MDARDVAHLRMRHLHLTGKRLPDPKSVVGSLGAVQSQDFGPAKWSLSQRMGRVADPAVEASFNEGRFLRTHVLRPTWHFVTPEDIVWMLELTGPRVLAASAGRFRQLGLDAQLLAKSRRILERTLRGGNALTRKEVREVLERGGIDVRDTSRLGWILMDAELRAVVCSGPVRGKQQTYALVEERAPTAGSLGADEALAELTSRFFTSHGPATVKDFRWWSGLKIADIRRGLEMVGTQLTSNEIEGTVYWFAGPRRYSEPKVPKAFLLQAYDEYTVAYTETKSVFDRGDNRRRTAPIGYGFLVLDTQVEGRWRRSRRAGEDFLEVGSWRRLRPEERAAIHEAGAEWGRFHSMTSAPDVRFLNFLRP